MHLSPQEREQVISILHAHVAQYQVRAYGSRVHGEHLKPTSDLDLCIISDTPLPLITLANLKEAFSASSLPFRVDVQESAAMKEQFLAIVNQQFEVIQEPNHA